MVLRVDVAAAALDAVYGGARPPRRRADTAGAAARPGRRRGARRRGAHDAALRPLRGLRRAHRQHLCSDAISIGPYVLSGGELAAMVMVDAIARLLPGRARRRGVRAHETLLGRARGRLRVPAVHAARRVPRLARARRPPLRRPRPDRRVAPGGEPGAERGLTEQRPPSDVEPDPLGGRGRALRRAGRRRAARGCAGSHDLARGRDRRRSGSSASAASARGNSRNPITRATAGLPRGCDHDRLDRDDRRRDRDRPRDQGVGREPVSDPVVLDGADAALRAARQRLRGAVLGPVLANRFIYHFREPHAATSSSSRRRRRPSRSAARAARS